MIVKICKCRARMPKYRSRAENVSNIENQHYVGEKAYSTWILDGNWGEYDWNYMMKRKIK